jgi:hypothetical protein
MKKSLLTTVALLFMVTGTAMALGEPGAGVLGSVHDMRVPSTYYSGATEAQDRVCAFCHTPHHAYVGAASDYYPLWARELPNTAGYQPYASSTMNAGDWATDLAIGPTRLCMSCHDGSIAVDQHYGMNGTGSLVLTETNAGFDDPNWFGGPGVGWGTNTLKNDHPVGFNYDAVAIGPDSGNPAGQLVTDATATQDPWIRNANGALSFGGTYNIRVADRLYTDPGTNIRYMTCATCHDVHNTKNQDATGVKNYLVIAPQRDSALCLTCHIK